MSNAAHSFARRHPHLHDVVHSLFETNEAFNDLCRRFGRVWDRLNEVENSDVGIPLREHDSLRREALELEYEMLGLLRDNMRT
jgi:uncharacterized protein YdcH (DUF465 family)